MQEADRQQFDQWFTASEPELRKIAAALKRFDKSVSLNVTALVNEAYLCLSESNTYPESELQLRQRTARVMRSILASAARKRQTLRRGEGMRFVAWDDSLQPLAQDDRELVALDDALSELEQLEPRHAQMIEWHFFGGMKWTEVAEGLNLPLTTVERDWRMLRAWLADVVRR